MTFTLGAVRLAARWTLVQPWQLLPVQTRLGSRMGLWQLTLNLGAPGSCCLTHMLTNMLTVADVLLSAGIAIGGDTFPGSTLSDHCIRYQNIPQIKMIVVLGELGGTDEYSLVNALKEGGFDRMCADISQSVSQ